MTPNPVFDPAIALNILKSLAAGCLPDDLPTAFGIDFNILRSDGSYGTTSTFVREIATKNAVAEPFSDAQLFDPYYVAKASQANKDAIQRFQKKNTRPFHQIIRRVLLHRSDYTDQGRAQWISEYRIPQVSLTEPSEIEIVRISHTLNDVLEEMQTDDGLERKLFAKLSKYREFALAPHYDFEYEHDLKGKFTSLNHDASELLGIPLDKLNQYAIFDILDDRQLRATSTGLIDAHAYRDRPRHKAIFLVRQWNGKSVRMEVVSEITQDRKTIKGKGRRLTSAIHETLTRYARVLDGGQVAGWDRQVGTEHIDTSRAWRAIVGFDDKSTVTRQEFLGRIHPDDRGRVEQAIVQNESVGNYDIEFKLTSADHRQKIIHSIGNRSTADDRANSPAFVSGRIEDITARVRNESLLKAVMDTCPQLIFIKNKAGQFAYVNRQLADFYKMGNPKLAEGKDDQWFYQGDDRTIITRQLALFRSGDQQAILGSEDTSAIIEEIMPPFGAECDRRWYSTVKRKVLIDGEPHVLGVATDVTDLAMRKDSLQQLFSHSPVIMYIKNSKGVYTEVNSAFVVAVGKNHVNEVLGQGAEAFFSGDELAAIQREDMDAWIFGEVRNREHQLKLPNGQRRVFVGNKMKTFAVGPDGKTEPQLIGVYVDVTDGRFSERFRRIEPFLSCVDHDHTYKFLMDIKGFLADKGRGTEEESHQSRILAAMSDIIIRTLGYIATARRHKINDESLASMMSPLRLAECIRLA
ncbi:MAG TPA: PAS domain-containing protein, partial [Gemmataceae bacterium]|nr:PAS domain-containing protein [Gemmataceae bacterium]